MARYFIIPDLGRLLFVYNKGMQPILFRAHAVQRMFERGVSLDSIRKALATFDIIEDYSSEMPEPGYLLYGRQGRHPFHVVVSQNNDRITVITVYLPSPDKWKNNYRNRR